MEKKKDKIIGIVFLTWFFGSLIAIFTFKEIAVIMAGQYFLVFGIVIATIAKPRNPIVGSLFALVGLGIIVATVLVKWGNKLNIHVNGDVLVPALLCSAFPLIGLFIFLIDIYEKKKALAVCKEKVKAECIEIASQLWEGSYLRSPIYEYTYNGIKYNYNPQEYSNVNVPEVGTSKEIYINPSNPEEAFVETPPVQKAMKYFIAVIFIIAGTAATIFILIKG